MLNHFKMFAAYNRWANRQVYAAAAQLTDSAYREDKGAFFGSLHRTLNHLLTADRIWQQRFTGTGDAPTTLDAILFNTLADLTVAREAEDQRIIDWVDGLSEDAFCARFTYTSITIPVAVTQALGPVLSHFFNHQTHHRGQAHMILTALGRPSLPLDLAYFLRSEGSHWA